jgi:uncharacterized protein (TIGR00251 family)
VADLEVSVVPRASREAVGPMIDGVLRVRVTRPPAEGEANRAVLRLVAMALDLRTRDVRLVAGERGRRKRIRVEGMEPGELERRLARIGRD